MTLLYRLLSLLPLSLLYILSTVTFFILFHGVRYRRAVVKDNLIHAFPNHTAEEIRGMSKQFYRHFCDQIYEFIHLGKMTEQELRKRIELTNFDVLQPYLEQQQSFIIVSIHQGNWEWLLQRVSVELPCEIDAIYKTLHDEQMETLALKTRRRFGADLIPFKRASKVILSKRREFRAFLMMADQSPSGKEKKYWRYYCHRPAGFYLGPEKLARSLNYPIVYIDSEKVSRGFYRAEFKVLAEPPYNDLPEFELLDRYIEAAEKTILEKPETYLWSYQRWRRTPRDHDTVFHAPDATD